MSETLTVERAQEFAETWRDEVRRYSALATTTRGDIAEGNRIMARDAAHFAQAFYAFVALAAAQRENEKWKEMASHLAWCATCANEGLGFCEVGREIDAALSGQGGA